MCRCEAIGANQAGPAAALGPTVAAAGASTGLVHHQSEPALVSAEAGANRTKEVLRLEAARRAHALAALALAAYGVEPRT